MIPNLVFIWVGTEELEDVDGDRQHSAIFKNYHFLGLGALLHEVASFFVQDGVRVRR